MEQKLFELDKNCSLLYITNYIENPSDLMIKLLADISFESKIVKLYGQDIPLPRLVADYKKDDNSYEYFNQMFTCLSDISKKLGFEALNNCSLNYYRNGKDYLGWYSPASIILTLYVGESRTLEIRKKNNMSSKELLIKSGSLLILYGCDVSSYEYKIKKEETNFPCISLMFYSV
jgi:hypothetical protein